MRCVGHQHIGSRCITLFNAETDEKICQSCPVYGNVTGAFFALAEGLYMFILTKDCLYAAACAAQRCLRRSAATGLGGGRAMLLRRSM